MPPKAPGNPKNRSKIRSKVSLACDSCRDKKIRCDGIKPICGPCVRRSYRNDQCVYNTENSRSTSRDEYVNSLHQRIRELEDVCLNAGASNPNATTSHRRLPGDSTGQELTQRRATVSNASGYSRPETTDRNQTPLSSTTGLAPRITLPCTQAGRDTSSTGENTSNLYESPLFDNDQGSMTGMGQMIFPGPEREDRRRSTRFQFYGTSSTASLMRFAYQRMPAKPADSSRAEIAYNMLQDTSTMYGMDDFSLPPRAFADHLVKRFFDKVFIIYPFFHRPAFEAAYHNLWRGEDEPNKPPPTDLQIGLGSRTESEPTSIVFLCSLNLIFALSCQFADIAPEEAESVANSFFLRAKNFIGLDFLDINTLGVVQTLLITALYLQSSPYPSRCWHSVGNACRVAFGLGLHKSDILTTLTPLESEIRKRTWHGCVIMDIPSMTSHLAPVRRPEGSEIPRCQDMAGEPSLMAFYNEAIKLYEILDLILGDVYNAWRGRLLLGSPQASSVSLGNLDIVLNIERELLLFKANVPSFLKWTSEGHAKSSSPDFDRAIAQQRNVLHARYIHLQLLLYRPIFTQLYSKRDSSSGLELQNDSCLQSIEMQSSLYSSIFTKCAEACVTAAIELTHLVRETYQTDYSDAWWYNGFFLLVFISSPSILDQSLLAKAQDAWKDATSVLEFMSTFCRSATNTLQFLQAAHLRAVPPGQHQTGTEADASRMPQPNHDDCDHAIEDLGQFPVFDWEEFAQSMVPGLDDLGFLTGFNFHDS
ncbi:fungal-specific transcription factor domain-containing protein [Aspergillus floccosus]